MVVDFYEKHPEFIARDVWATYFYRRRIYCDPESKSKYIPHQGKKERQRRLNGE